MNIAPLIWMFIMFVSRKNNNSKAKGVYSEKLPCTLIALINNGSCPLPNETIRFAPLFNDSEA